MASMLLLLVGEMDDGFLKKKRNFTCFSVSYKLLYNFFCFVKENECTFALALEKAVI